jgi:hypothetical protein
MWFPPTKIDAARHRHRHPVRRLPHALPGRQGRRRLTRKARACPKVSAGERAKETTSRRPAFHRAAAALFRSQSGQKAGRARHRPALDLCLHPLHLRDRAYVRMDRGRFPEDKGRLVTIFLAEFLRRYVEYDFTADLEEKLDRGFAGELDWKALLRDFWKDFSAPSGRPRISRSAGDRRARRDAWAAHLPRRPRTAPIRANAPIAAGTLSLKLGRFGAFVGCSNYPECKFTRQIGPSRAKAAGPPRVLGLFPGTGEHDAAPAASGPMCSWAKAKSPSAAALPKGTDPAKSTCRWR